MLHKILCCNQSNRAKCSVILILVIVLCLENPIQCLKNVKGLPSNDSFVEKCEQTCLDQNRTYSEMIDVGKETLCRNECRVKQCSLGCSIWDLALDSSCQKVCNKSDISDFDNRQIFCVKGCIDASNFYFDFMRQEFPNLLAPALVPDSLTSTTLSLEWSVPERFNELVRGRRRNLRKYFVQCLEEDEADWKICGNQTIYANSTIHLEQLQPYTKYKFRVALLLSENEAITSDSSVVISTNEEGVPESSPTILNIKANDQTRIHVTWKPGTKNNGPIISYSLQIRDLTQSGYTAVKEVPENSDRLKYYMFEKLTAGRNYSIQIRTRNARGVGPAVEGFGSTAPHLKNEDSKVQDLKIILASENEIWSRGTSFLIDQPVTFYTTNNNISGIALDVHRKQLFIAESDGCIYQTSLDLALKTEKREVICQKKGLNFMPQLVSVDWLNKQLYILGEITSNTHVKTWSISRCDFDGKKLIVAIAGLNAKPLHIEVDPYNGYLFWVIPADEHIEGGLYRLDLYDVSKETTPFVMIKGRNLGAFTVDHSRFRLSVPTQDDNTIMSVSLSGKDIEDIRRNTQSSQLHQVKSLAQSPVGLFYWTNGKELLAEEYHSGYHAYFHNSYPVPSNRKLVAIRVNSTASQPIPIPVNSPQNCQALLESKKAKVSWLTPQLVGDQGKGAFKNWSYRLEVFGENRTQMFENITGNSYVVQNLSPDTLYSFKVTAYTSGGVGSASHEFRARTLKTSDDTRLVWASNDGLMQSDIIGENIKTLLSREELGDDHVNDIAWFGNILYIVVGHTLKIYNQTDGRIFKIGELDSVGSVAVDWLGMRLYWSNPSQQLIHRGNLNGENPDPDQLLIVASAREIKIDAIRGNIYFSTGLTVEGCRLNSKEPTTYFTVQQFSGKQVMGLTLDLDNENIYWIVRSYEGSSLYSAKLLDIWLANRERKINETKLDERSINGSLTHFSDRLVWQQDNRTIVFGDTDGKNLAYFQNDKLNGLTRFMVIDRTHLKYPEISSGGGVRVIPDPVPAKSIQIIGSYKIFNITWERVTNVNYGKVFYEIQIRTQKSLELTSQTAEINVYQFPSASSLVPYTPLEILIRAYTYWGSATHTKVTLYSPPGLPSAPTNPIVYTQHLHYPLEDATRVSATFRWSLPEQPNGEILGYKVNCYEFDRDGLQILKEHKSVIMMEQTFSGLKKNDRYKFEVTAYTSVGEGNKSIEVTVDTTHERPIPIILVSTSEDILEVDLDRRQSRMLIGTRIPVVAMTHIAHESKLFWFDENNDLVSYHTGKHVKSKLISTKSTVKCMTIDWLERIIYWSQSDDNKSGAVIYSLNLNKAEKNSSMRSHEKLMNIVLEQQNDITDLVISPFDRKLFWIENHKNLTEESSIHYLELDTGLVKSFFNNGEECMNKTSTTISPIPGTLVFATSAINPQSGSNDDENQESNLIFEMSNQYNQNFVRTKLNSKECFEFGQVIPAEGTNLAKDSNKFYWIHEEMVYAREDESSRKISYQVPKKSNQLLAFYQQRYPLRVCSIPMKSYYIIQLKEATDNSLKFELPKPKVANHCRLSRIPVKYTIQYTDIKRNGNENLCEKRGTCREDETFEQIETIENLKPFTNYYVKVAMTSIFDTTKTPEFIATGEFMTDRGRPSPPRNVTAMTLSFNEIMITWLQPEIFNSDEIFYEIHWQQENMIEHIKNKQQQSLPNSKRKTHNNQIDEKISTNIKVQPNQTYSIFIRAYSKNHTFSESESVTVMSYPEPKPLVLASKSPTSMIISWKKSENISKYAIQYTQQDSIQNVINATNEIFSNETAFFQIDSLEPKTKYNFTLLLTFVNSNQTYRWTSPEKIEFETDGDRPSQPGRPIVEYVAGNVYKVTWNVSKDNGAPILEYILESKRDHKFIIKDKETDSLRARRSVSEHGSGFSADVEPIDVTEMPNEIDDEIVHDEKWSEKYRGVDSHWIVKDINNIEQYIFRVQAVNLYGQSDWSLISEFVNNTSHRSGGVTSSAKITNWMTFGVVTFSAVVIVFCVAYVLIVNNRNNRDKKFTDSGVRIPDFELATLRDLHAGEHLILSNRNILYNQFNGSAFLNTEIKHLPHIHLSQIIITDRCLGKGAFGEVWCGIVQNDDGTEERVAIKTLHKGANENEKREFLQEAQLMSNFKHDHILRLIGICLNNNNSLLYIVMELMEGGDLLSFLRNNRPTATKGSTLMLSDLVSMCVDVASGCRYLEEKHFVHRDIAARNCLVKNVLPTETGHCGRVVKIGDFGLARDIYKNDYYRKEGEGLLPVRWMSPESLIDGVFTSQSDIWAFGVLMWEIITLGQQPYQGQTNIEVLHYVRGGGRLPRPYHNCPELLYQLMSKCWNRTDLRPTFRYCLEDLQQINEQQNFYAKIEAQFPHDVPYKCVSSDDSMSLVNEHETSVEDAKLIAQPSTPRYLELTYDENDSQTNDSFNIEIPSIIEEQPIEIKVNENNAGYETPLTIEDAIPLTLYGSLETDEGSLSAKSRTLSNSSTVSNKSEHFPIVPESFPPLPDTCKRSSLILVDRDHHNKIYPATKVITRQSGWV